VESRQNLRRSMGHLRWDFNDTHEETNLGWPKAAYWTFGFLLEEILRADIQSEHCAYLEPIAVFLNICAIDMLHFKSSFRDST